MAGSTIYSIDSSALIHGWRRAYRPKNFGFVWEHSGKWEPISVRNQRQN